MEHAMMRISSDFFRIGIRFSQINKYETHNNVIEVLFCMQWHEPDSRLVFHIFTKLETQFMEQWIPVFYTGFQDQQ